MRGYRGADMMKHNSAEKTQISCRILLGSWLLLGALCVWPAAASQVQARLDSSRARIGDRLTLTLTAHSAAGETVQFPDLESHLDKFVLLDELPAERVEEEGGAALIRRSWVIAAFETGRLEVSGLPLAVMHADGVVDTLWTEPLPLEVISLVQDTLDAQIRPLRSLVEAPRLWKRIAFWAVLGLAVLAALFMLWRSYLRRRADRLAGNVSSIPARPAHLVALDELDRIKSLGLIENGEVKRFHILVSEAIRCYLEARYDVLAPEMTTWELTAALKGRRDMDPGLKELLRGFLEDCDMVKFAKYVPKIVEINATFNRAYEIVEKSRPVERPQPQAPAGNTTDADSAQDPGVAAQESAGERR